MRISIRDVWVEFSDSYRKALAVIPKEDLKLYENN